MKRPLASLLAVALVLGAPGTGAYRAAAQVVQVPGGLAAPVGGSASAAGAGVLASPAGLHSPAAGLVSAAPSLGPSLIPISAPEVRLESRAGLAAIARGPVAARAASIQHRDQAPLFRNGLPATSLRSQGHSKRKRALEREQKVRGLIRRLLTAVKGMGRSQTPPQTYKIQQSLFDGTGKRSGHVAPDRRARDMQDSAVSISIPWNLHRYVVRTRGASEGLIHTPPQIQSTLDRELAEGAEEAGREAKKEPPKTPERKALFSIGKAAVMFILALVLAQLGAEAVGAALPTLIQKTFGDFAGTVTQIAIFSYLADFTARQFAPIPIKRFGLKKVFLSAHSMKLISMGTLALLLGTGNITLGLLKTFILINAFLGGITSTTENSTPPALVGQDPAALERYWTREQAVRQIMSISAPIATGAVVASVGFFPAFVAFPVSTAMALYVVWRLVNIPTDRQPRFEERPRDEAGDKVEAPKKGKARLKAWLSQFGRGARIVWRHKGLRWSAIASAAYIMIGAFMYALLAPAYGLLLAGPGAAEFATGISGFIIGFFNLGGLLGVVRTIRSEKRLTKRIEKGEVEREEVKRILFRSLRRYMLFGAIGLTAMATFAIPGGTLGAWITLPAALKWLGALSLPAAALIPMGYVHVVTMLKLRSFFQSRVPDRNDMPEAMGFLGASTLVVQALGLMLLRVLFGSFTGFMPFVVLCLALAPLAMFYLFLRNRITKYGAPPQPTIR